MTAATLTGAGFGAAALTGCAGSVVYSFGKPGSAFGGILEGGTVTGFAGSGANYSFDVTAPDGQQGNITVDIYSSAAFDLVGNSSYAASQSVQAFDRANPTVSISDSQAGTASDGSPVVTSDTPFKGNAGNEGTDIRFSPTGPGAYLVHQVDAPGVVLARLNAS